MIWCVHLQVINTHVGPTCTQLDVSCSIYFDKRYLIKTPVLTVHSFTL